MHMKWMYTKSNTFDRLITKLKLSFIFHNQPTHPQEKLKSQLKINTTKAAALTITYLKN